MIHEEEKQFDARDVLNALTAHIAVLDSRGVIVAVNEAWIRFAKENGATDEKHYVGYDYVAACDRALEKEPDEQLANLTSKLRGLLRGGDGNGEVTLEYPCHSPECQRWFNLRATRLQRGMAGVVIAHENVTDRKRAEEALRETERTLRLVLESLPVGVWLMDRKGRIVSGNPAGRQIWGGARYVGPEEFGAYKGWWLGTGRPIAAEEWAAARAILKGESAIGEEIEIESFDGVRKIILNSAVPLFDENQTIQGAIIVNEDVTAAKRAESELRRAKEEIEAASHELEIALARERILARVDALTGATNRRQFFDLATQEISVAERYHEPLSLIIFDVDNFKQINDTLGHHAGDELLRRVSRTVTKHLRDADLFARYGGDEFVVLLPHTRVAEASAVAERMRADLAAQGTVLEHGASTITISSGIAELLPTGDTLDALIHRADMALYTAKQAGRNRTAIFTARTPAMPPL